MGTIDKDILITRATGVGLSLIETALGFQAYSMILLQFPNPYRANNEKAGIIFDDCGLEKMKPTIIITQLSVVIWYDSIRELTITDAILNRLVYNSHRVDLKGKSVGYKFKKSLVKLLQQRGNEKQ